MQHPPVAIMRLSLFVKFFQPTTTNVHLVVQADALVSSQMYGHRLIFQTIATFLETQ